MRDHRSRAGAAEHGQGNIDYADGVTADDYFLIDLAYLRQSMSSTPPAQSAAPRVELPWPPDEDEDMVLG